METDLGSRTVHLPANVTRTNNYIGRSNWPDEYFKGQMVEVAIFDRPLTHLEINTFIEPGVSSDVGNPPATDQ